jgi:hypothetical protein
VKHRAEGRRCKHRVAFRETCGTPGRRAAERRRNTIQALLAAASQPAERRAARIAWAKKTAVAWRDAQREMDDRCSEAVERLDEEAFERLCDAEQAKVDAIVRAAAGGD